MEKINHNSLCETETHKVGMTDNEIKKALECCIETSTVLACADCPLLDTKQCIGKPKTYVSNFIMEQGIDLINRKNAEIESQEAIIERLKECVEEAYEDAIKEFAERLKEMPSVMNCEYEWLHTDIDNLVKEMMEKGGEQG